MLAAIALLVVGCALVGVGPAAAAPSITRLSPATGVVTGGTAVTITGRGFSGVPAVRFGTQDALEVRLDSDTADVDQITAFSPPQASPSDTAVQVQVLVGSEWSEGVTFTYVPGGFTDTAPMAGRHRDHNATLLNDGTVLVDSPTPLEIYGQPRRSEVFVPGGPGRPATWRPSGPPVVLSRQGYTSTKLPDGRVLVAGGGAPGDSTTEVYEPDGVYNQDGSATSVRGSWHGTAAMAVDRRGHGAALLPSRGWVLVAGGTTGGGVTSSAELFKTNPDRWSSTGALVDPRTDHTTTVLSDGKVLVAGGRGRTGSPLRSAEIYDPAAAVASGSATLGKWSTTGSMGTARAGHRATALSDGRVLVVGGGGADGKAVASAEIFDPRSGKWAPAASPSVARFGHSVTLLENRRVLVAGGNLSEGETKGMNEPGISSAELYDPDTDSWAPTTPLSGARTDHSATVLDSGQVLIAGGGGPSASTPGYTVGNLTSAELFDPEFRPVPRVSKIEPADGPEVGGTPVHILGAYLFGGHRTGEPASYFTVRFGTEPAASVRAVSDRELIAVSPPGRRLVDVTVTTELGTSSKTAATQFVYGRGGWTPASSCPEGAPCPGRADQNAVVLDPPKCHTSTPPPDRYPCGRVLVTGKTRRTFAVSNVDVTAKLLTSALPEFTPADVGQGIDTTVYLKPLNTIVEVVDARTIRLAEPPERVTIAALTGTSGEVYDPVADRWSPVAAMTDRHGSHMHEVTFTSTLLPDGRVLIAGGCCDPNGAPDPRNRLPLATATVYDPVLDRWSPTGPMKVARTGHTATLLDGPACRRPKPPASCGKVLVTGGLTLVNDGELERALTDTAELYDPADGSWSSAPKMGKLRAAHTATVLPDGDVLIVGGTGLRDCCDSIDEVPLYSAERFDPVAWEAGDAKPWTATGELPNQEGKALHTATLLNPPACATHTEPTDYPCGRVLVTGGSKNFFPANYDAFDARSSVRLYDPGSNTWSSLEDMAVTRENHTATLLPDGSVLLAGGFPDAHTAEIYDPGTGRTRLTLALGTARASHTATLLDAQPCGSRCGQVLAVGGRAPIQTYDFLETPLTNAELYTPAPFAGHVSPATGTSAGSTPVVITGTNLLGVTGVSFGGVAATSFTVDSYSQITATTPHHPAGAASVELTSAAWPAGTGLPGRAPPFTFTRSKPAAPTDLLARPLSATEVEVAFTAVGSDADNPPPATHYEIRQATSPITGEAAFAAATRLCDPSCAFNPPTLATPLRLNISNLAPSTTYHYAVKALDPSGIAGGLSNPASATTGALAPTAAPTSTSAPRPPGTAAPRASAPRTAAPQVTTRTGTTPPATTRPVSTPPALSAAVLAAPAGPGNMDALAPPAATPKVLFTPAQQADPPAATDARRVIPTWLTVITAISVIINLAVLGAYLNRRLRR